jgi:hypothetical protein
MSNPPEGIRSVLRSIEPYQPGVKALALLNVIGWALFELWAVAGGGDAWTVDGRWHARTSVWIALLLFDLVAVIWWYTEVASRQCRLAEQARSDANRPFAVIDRQRMPEAEATPGEHLRYVVRNIGSGLAVNVFYVVEDDAGLNIRSMGALAGQADRALADAVARPLQAAAGAAHHFVMVAEGLASQAGRWTVTVNALLPTGEVAHRIVWLEQEKRSDSLRSWLDYHWPTVKGQIAVLDGQNGR